MSKVLSNTTQALQSGKKSIETISDNITSSNIVGAHKIDAVTTVSAYSGGDSLGIKTTTIRADDLFLQQSVRTSLTETAKAEVIDRYSQEIQIAISQPDQSNNSVLVDTTNALITAAKGDGGDNPQLIKQDVVAKAKDFTHAYNSVIEKIDSLDQQASKDLENYITELNSNLQSLAKINSSSNNTTINTRLMDERDRRINNIAEILPVKVQPLSNGQVCVRGPQGISLVDSTSRAEFNYTNSILTVSFIDQRGKKSAPLEIPISQCNGGVIGGLIELQKNILPETREKVVSSYQATVKEVNRICNNSSTYPPKTKLQGQTTLRLSDEFKASGKCKVAFTDNNGNSLTGSTGRVRDITVNLDHLGRDGGNVKAKDLINELNEALRATSSPRIALGEIRDKDDNPIANNFLLNDIQLVTNSKLSNGNLRVGLFVDGNNYFGSKVQITNMNINSNGVNTTIPTNQLPQIVTIDKEFCGTIDGQVALTNINAGDVIEVGVRVDGGNGVTQTGFIDFTVPADINSIKANGRIVGNIPGGGIPGNEAQALVGTHAAIGTAKLVDKDGNEITDNNEEGTIVIETANDHYRLVISEGDSQMVNAVDGSEENSKGFSHYLGLNNLFIENPNGTTTVRDDIATDPNLLPTATLTKSDGAKTTVKVGDVAASHAVNFTGNLPNNGNSEIIVDNVTGMNYTFTFGAQVPIVPGDWTATLANLKASIEADPICKNLVTISQTAASLTFTAKNSGASGNNIFIDTAFAAGGVEARANGVHNLNAALVGGSDKDEEITTYNYSMGAGSIEGLQEIGNLSTTSVETESGQMTVTAYASVISATIGNQVDTAKNNASIATATFNTYNDKLQTEVGINVYEEYTDLMRMTQYMQANMAVIRTMQQLWQSFIDAY